MDLLARVVGFFEVSVGSDLVVQMAKEASMDGGCAVGVEVEAAAVVEVEGVCGVGVWFGGVVSIGCMEVGSMLKDEDLLSYWLWWRWWC